MEFSSYSKHKGRSLLSALHTWMITKQVTMEMIKTIQQRSPLYYTCSCVAFNIGSWMSVYILCNALKPPGKLCNWREKQNDWGEIGVLSALK